MDGLGLATAKGHLFVTLEDEEGLVNLIVRPDVYERYRDALRNAPLLWAEGRLQREGQALSMLVYRAGVGGLRGSERQAVNQQLPAEICLDSDPSDWRPRRH
jgi:DNA polymerase III alpha subunit